MDSQVKNVQNEMRAKVYKLPPVSSGSETEIGPDSQMLG